MVINMNNIVLVGYMGSGKTTVGKHLSRMLGLLFLDTDEAIEAEQGITITEIFQQKGEAGFRDIETAYLKKLHTIGKRDLVLSTGGGMPLREENRELLRKIGTVVYLKSKPETIYERVKGDTKRPLLQCEDPLKKIQEMIDARNAVYESVAHITIQVDTLTQAEVAEKIREEWTKNENTGN